MVNNVLFLNFFHEHFGGLECRNLVLRDDDGGVLGDIACSLFGTGLDDEAAEATQVNVLAVRQRVLYNLHELLYCFEYDGLFDAGRF